jgi:hypothetical protein
MGNQAPPSLQHEAVPKWGQRRRVGLFVFVVVLLFVSILVLSLVSVGLFAPLKRVEITASAVSISSGPSTNYTRVDVDVTIYNPGRGRRTTVWAEITDQPTNVSFSKTQSVQLGYRQSKTLTFEFILDSQVNNGDFSHHVWLTYPNSQD